MKSFLILILLTTLTAISFKVHKDGGITIYVSKEICERNQVRMGASKVFAIETCEAIRRFK